MPYDVVEAAGAAAETVRQIPIPGIVRPAVGASSVTARPMIPPYAARPESSGGGSVRTYFYRTALGLYGSTQDSTTIPSGAVVLRVT